MAQNYFALLTADGRAAAAAAQAANTPVQLYEMAVGDSGGTSYEPTGFETALKNEVWRGAISNLMVDPTNPNQMIVEAVIPVSQGGWFIREVTIITEAGKLYAIGAFPDTYKPTPAEGGSKELVIRIVLAVVSNTNPQLVIDTSQVLATRQYVDDALKNAGGQSRKTISLTTSSIANSANRQGTVSLAASFTMIGVTASAYCRIRLYSTAAQQAADINRLATNPPTPGTQHGVIMDLVLDESTGLSWIMSPVASGSNGNALPSEAIYYTVQNLSGSTAEITVDFTILATEQHVVVGV